MRPAGILLLLTLCVFPLTAQFRGAIQGTIKDTSGAVIPNAKVTLTNTETGRRQTTSAGAEGVYHFGGLAPGSYDIEAGAKGMRTAQAKDVALSAEATSGVDLTLEAGAITETVTVTSNTTPILPTETADIAAELTPQAVRNLPQVGRHPYELLRLVPGIFGDAARSGQGGALALPNATGPGGSNNSIFQTE